MGLKSQFGDEDGFQVANSPGQMGDDHGHKPVFNHCLHLLLVSCCYVGQEPHRLLQVNKIRIFSLNRSNYLVDLLLAVVEKAWEVLQCSLKYSKIARHFILGMGLEPKCI